MNDLPILVFAASGCDEMSRVQYGCSSRGGLSECVRNGGKEERKLE